MQDIVMTSNRDNALASIFNFNRGFLPWGPAGAASGELWRASTNLGKQVLVWVPDEANTLRRSYFCHGWALGTYQLHGYTVPSGPGLATVLSDEWDTVQVPMVGDICVWYGNAGGIFNTPLHSARVEVAGGIGADMLLSSKNGNSALGGLRTFAQVDAIYRAAPQNLQVRRFYRRRVPLPMILPLLAE